MLRLLAHLRMTDLRRFVDLAVLLASSLIASLLVYRWNEESVSAFQFFSSTIVLFQFVFLLPVVFRERKWRYVSAYDAFQIAKYICLSTPAFWVFTQLIGVGGGGRRWLVLNMILTIFSLCSVRLLRRLIFELRNTQMIRRNGVRTLIFGTGITARSLAFRYMNNPDLQVCIEGFIDFHPTQVGASVLGLRVLGTLESLPVIIESHHIQNIIVADPDISGPQLAQILKCAQIKGIKPRLASTHRNEILRDVELVDLLARPAIQVDLESTRRIVFDQVVMVTGGGGSIGSELVRQIVHLQPKMILILDQSEYSLYAIETYLKELGVNVPFVSILSDLKEFALLEQIFQQYQPRIIFHAAAYKHVHLVETNANHAIINNLLATKNLLQCSTKLNVEYFVLISSDKAVNPKGIMGSTKRLCELMVSEAAVRTGRRFCSVRFGNVLGSSGSLIPLLKKQIEDGGPITITHKDMERYFMLIPEAVSLVLKAASISHPGDINILRMGNPIKIVDIAKNLLTLMGLSEKQIPLMFTGIRPGEKLKEELYLSGDELTTEHADILVLPKGAHIALSLAGSASRVEMHVDEILEKAKTADNQAKNLLLEMVQPRNKRDELSSEGDFVEIAVS